MYDFDRVVQRKNTNSIKFDINQERFGKEDILSMWVADMDFKVAPEITKAFEQRIAHGIYGYTVMSDDLYQSIINWNKNEHNWTIQKDWITFCTGVVPALHFAVMAFTDPGDKVIVQSPVYYPFFNAVSDHDRILINNTLKWNGDQYVMDIEDLLSQIDDQTKMILLCSPHNPVGRVWTKEELSKLADICIKKDIVVLSDEVHADLAFNDHKHIPFASLSPEISERTITLMAPSKTFNLAGLTASYIVTENKKLRNKLNAFLDTTNINYLNLFGAIGMEVAYSKGKPWLDALKKYIWDNYLFLKDTFEQRIPQIKVYPLEATYLVWLDCSELNLDDSALRLFFIEEAQIALNPGTIFGRGGEGFHRINIACPRSTLEKGIALIESAVNKQS